MELKRLLARTGQSIPEFAIKAGVSKVTATNWMEGHNEPLVNNYKRIGEALGVETDTIFDIFNK